MTERQQIAQSIARRVSDYRSSDNAQPSAEHVERWVNQFSPEAQLPILREMDHVLARTYFSSSNVSDFLRVLIAHQSLVGNDPAQYWRTVRFLNNQGGGNSQREMLLLLDRLLQQAYGVSIAQCGTNNPSAYVYLDDAVFTGNRVLKDMGLPQSRWVSQTLIPSR